MNCLNQKFNKAICQTKKIKKGLNFVTFGQTWLFSAYFTVSPDHFYGVIIEKRKKSIAFTPRPTPQCYFSGKYKGLKFSEFTLLTGIQQSTLAHRG